MRPTLSAFEFICLACAHEVIACAVSRLFSSFIIWLSSAECSETPAITLMMIEIFEAILFLV
jgi:hypothetical protein